MQPTTPTPSPSGWKGIKSAFETVKVKSRDMMFAVKDAGFFVQKISKKSIIHASSTLGKLKELTLQVAQFSKVKLGIRSRDEEEFDRVNKMVELFKVETSKRNPGKDFQELLDYERTFSTRKSSIKNKFRDLDTLQKKLAKARTEERKTARDTALAKTEMEALSRSSDVEEAEHKEAIEAYREALRAEQETEKTERKLKIQEVNSKKELRAEIALLEKDVQEAAQKFDVSLDRLFLGKRIDKRISQFDEGLKSASRRVSIFQTKLEKKAPDFNELRDAVNQKLNDTILQQREKKREARKEFENLIEQAHISSKEKPLFGALVMHPDGGREWDEAMAVNKGNLTVFRDLGKRSALIREKLQKCSQLQQQLEKLSEENSEELEAIDKELNTLT